MNKLTSIAALVAVTLIGSMSESACSDETTSNGSAVSAEQTPVPASGVVPGWYPPPNQAGYAQSWQQPPRWHVPQQVYGHLPPHYTAGGQYRTFPAAAAAAWDNPLSAKLKQTQEQLTAKSSELDMAHSMLEQLRGKLQDSHAVEEILSDKMAYSTREQQALRVRVTELTETLNTSNATLEQQHQLINNHQAHNQELTAERDQLHSKLASQDELLAALQSELQVAMQTLAQARFKVSTAGEALSAAKVQVGTHREELPKLEGKLESREKNRLQSDQKTQTE